MMYAKIRNGLVSLGLAGVIAGTAATGVLADPVTTTVERNGAAGLVAVVVDLERSLNNNQFDIAVVELNNSLNNTRALNNVLNNNDVDITVGDVTVLQDFLNDNTVTLDNFLNNNDILNIDADDVVAIGILNGQDVILFV